MKKLTPAKFFLIASLLFGVLYALFVPYGAGFDEERHLARIYYMSQGEMMPNFPKPRINKEVFDLSYQRRFIQSPAFDMYTQDALSQRFSRDEESYQYGYKTQSIYSPVIFLPHAIIGRALWWKFDLPILPTIMLQRLSALLIYIVGTYFAIRMLPFGKWGLAVLALTPGAIYQTVTLNADGFTNVANFLFIAAILAIYQNEKEGVQKRSIFLLVFLMVWLGTAKPGAIILLPLLLLLVKHAFPAKRWVALLFTGVVVSLVLNIGWWVLAAQGSTFGGDGEQSVFREIASLSSDGLEFISMLLQSIIITFPLQIKGWIGMYGFGAGHVPPLTYWFWLPVVLAAFALEGKKVLLDRRVRIFFVSMFLFASLAIYTMVFIPSHVYGGLTALSKHGRYFIPFAPMLFIGLTGIYSIDEKWQRITSQGLVLFFLLAQGFYSFGIYTTYYTYCNYGAYAGAQCSLPIYKNLEKENSASLVLRDDGEVIQSFIKSCGTLESVEIYINQKVDDLQGELTFSLLDPDQTLLWETKIQAEDIRNFAYLNFPLEGLSETNLDVYLMRLTTTGMPAEGLGLALTPADFYPGNLSVNGEVFSQDLLIHYVCTTP